MHDKKEWIASLATGFMETSLDNRMGGSFGEEKMWDTPIVRFASGADALFKTYKTPEVCSEEHWLPEEIFAKFYPEENAAGDALTLVSWILPQTRLTRNSLRKEKTHPSERWARARVFGEKINEKLRIHLVDTLKEAGYQACAPVLHPEWTRLEGVQRVYSSKWSERHVAYTAGHGTFGLCDAMITPVGKAVRFGSIIVKLKLEPDKRPYQGLHDYCLHYHKDKGECGLCVKRCPVGALDIEKGHDKIKCRIFLRGEATAYVKEHFGFDGYGCGLCQVGVPCEKGIPKKLLV
ncbi:MAG: epoxyqueuosine reductase [Candidatus Accumulibacter sp.]|jgi:epoxyqueuosine reductase QueG|nr:epoxyqueuosine reductase [Accumulibacter sp.]